MVSGRQAMSLPDFWIDSLGLPFRQVIARSKEFHNMNVLLIYPKFPDTFWSFTYALSFIGKKAAFPPLGLLTVAALLPEEWPKRLVDVNVDNLTDKDLLWADMAFIGGMAVQRKSAKQIIARCNASNLKVVAGGPLFPFFTKEFAIRGRRWALKQSPGKVAVVIVRRVTG
jgi:radical SAM superfamily enzyme YgiQ (UPF0313 family)